MFHDRVHEDNVKELIAKYGKQLSEKKIKEIYLEIKEQIYNDQEARLHIYFSIITLAKAKDRIKKKLKKKRSETKPHH